MMPPCNLDDWQDPGIPMKKPKDSTQRREHKLNMKLARQELQSRILHWHNRGYTERLAPGSEPPIYDVVISPFPVDEHFVYLAPSVWHGDTARLRALLPGPGIVPDLQQRIPDVQVPAGDPISDTETMQSDTDAHGQHKKLDVPSRASAPARDHGVKRQSPRKASRRAGGDIQTLSAIALPSRTFLHRTILPSLLVRGQSPVLCGTQWGAEAVRVAEDLLRQGCRADNTMYRALRRHETAQRHGYGTCTWMAIKERSVFRVIDDKDASRDHELRVEYESEEHPANSITQNLPCFVTNVHTAHAPSRDMWSAVAELVSTLASNARFRIVATSPGSQLPEGTLREDDWAWTILLMGTKTFHLLPPSDEYPRTGNEAPGLTPETHTTLPWCKCELALGQVLFIPPGWWYTVTSSDCGSVMLVIALDIDVLSESVLPIGPNHSPVMDADGGMFCAVSWPHACTHAHTHSRPMSYIKAVKSDQVRIQLYHTKRYMSTTPRIYTRDPLRINSGQCHTLK